MLDTTLLTQLEQAGPMERAWRTGMIGLGHSQPGDMVCVTEDLTLRYNLTPGRKRHESGRLFELETGMGWLVPADTRIVCGYESSVRGMTLQLPRHTLEEVLPEGTRIPDLPFVELEDPIVAQMMFNIYQAARSDDAYSALYRDTMTLALAAHLFRAYGRVEDRLADRADPRIRRVLDYIEEHLAEPITLDELAAVATMSRYHFAKTFKDHTSLPPHRYVAERRIERAKRLLEGSNLPAAEIAYQVGYSSQSNFTATFRKLTGVTPARYRTALH